jgi:hypothetical protein
VLATANTLTGLLLESPKRVALYRSAPTVGLFASLVLLM